ncbi:hypothetical protein Tco_0353176, partial [Tanacetum coccineum]
SLCEKFHIPDAVHPELPGRNDRIRNNPTVIRYCVRHGLSFRDLVPRPWFCSDRRKFPEPFLCFVGISRYYDLDDNCYPTFLTKDDEEMDLFAFIRHADPTKVRIGEREVGEGEVQLLELTRGRVVPLAEIPVDAGVIHIDDVVPATVAEKPKVQKRMRRAEGTSGSIHHPKKLTEDHDTSGDVGASTEVGVTTAAIVPFVTSSVTPMPKHGDGGPTDSVFVGNLWTQCPSKRSSVPPPPLMTKATATTVVADTSSALVRKASHEPVHHTLFSDPASMGEANQDVADVDSETLYQKYIPKWSVNNDSALDDPDICRGVIDHLAHPTLFFSAP